MTVVESLAKLYTLKTPTDEDMVYVRGFRDKNDGGGGFFIFDKLSTLDPVYDVSGNEFIGYFDANYDGMVCKAENLKDGRWIRQWDRGKLNLRWFGATPGNSSDASRGLNVALKYAQFEVDFYLATPNNATIYNDKVYTRPAKTIFIPTGRYYMKSRVSEITYGVIIEGEGNMGTSSNGTRLLILHECTAPNKNEFGFLRFVANGSQNSGGGLKDLCIEVANNTDYNSNIVYLISPQTKTDAELYPQDSKALTYNPSVAKWTGQNLVFALKASALRAIYMKSNQVGGNLPWRIRDASLVNCWFAGASIEGETVRAENVSGLHVIGGLFSSGLGVGNKPISPGIVLGGNQGCANTHLNGVDLTHGIIFIYKKSYFINIDCRFGKLLIYNGPGKKHIDLQVSKRYVLNPRTDTKGHLNCADSPKGYKCYNNAHEIENDTDADWMHNDKTPM